MKTINFCNHGLQICKEGVLFWLEKEIAVVSDLHLEKGSSYASSGQYIPPYDSEETLLNLFNVINNYKVRKVILLGDTFHDKDAFYRMSSKVRCLFEYFIKKYEVIFILGNHENKIKIEGIKFHQEYIVDNIHFLHEAIQKNINQISGHFHPVATINIGSRKITAKCFIHTVTNLILPSFGEYTGGLNIKNNIYKSFFKKKYRIYILGKKSVYELPKNLIE